MTTQEAAMRDALEVMTRQLEIVGPTARGTRDAIDSIKAALAQQGEQPVCAGCGIPVGDVHMSTCQSGKWPSRVSTSDTAAPAPQPARKTLETMAAEAALEQDAELKQPAQGEP